MVEPDDFSAEAIAEPCKVSADSGSSGSIEDSTRAPSYPSAGLAPDKADSEHGRTTKDNFAGFPLSFAGIDFSQCIAIFGKPHGSTMVSRDPKDPPGTAPADHSFADTSDISDSPNALQPVLICSEPLNVNDVVLHRGTIQRRRRRIPHCSQVAGRRSEDDAA